MSDALGVHRVLHLREAASLLGVSLMTVRRDVAENPAQFAYLGGHIVHAANIEGEGPYDLAKAADRHAAAKRAASAHAFKHVHADETVFFDCGTTLVHLIDLIPDNLPITAVCYALNVADRLSRKPNISLVMLGGLYHASSGSFAGESGRETLSRLGINTAFLTAAGIDARRGATCANFHEAPIKMQVMDIAQRNFLVTDNSKIGRVRPAYFAALDAFDAIFTEDGVLGTGALSGFEATDAAE
nr:DeoR family transcriptional regulator [Nitratireductor luteus]